MDSYWLPDVKAMLDSMTSYGLTLEEFKQAIMVKGLSQAKSNGGHAWIVDSSTAKGAFNQDIQNFIGSDVFPAFAKAGIKYFITVMPKASAITKMTVKNFSSKTGPNGIQLVEVDSLDDAIDWLKKNQ